MIAFKNLMANSEAVAHHDEGERKILHGIADRGECRIVAKLQTAADDPRQILIV